MQELEKFKNEMNLSGKNVYVGHRYVPKIMGEWDNTQIYEPLSIVQYQGASYTSRQYVPVGIELTNEDYWAVTGNYNAQVEEYRQDVRNLENDVNIVNGEVINARNGEPTLSERLDNEQQEVNDQLQEVNAQLQQKINGINVALAWGIQENIDQTSELQLAIENLPDNSTIYFPKGTYLIKNIDFLNKKNIHIVGENAKLINDSVNYNIFNFKDCDGVSVEGLEFISTWNSYVYDKNGQGIFCLNSKNILINKNKFVRGGMRFYECSNVNIYKNTVEDTTKVNQYSCYIRNGINVTVDGNYFSHVTSDGVKISTSILQEIPNEAINTVITNNHIFECGDDGIDLFAGGYKSIVANNFLYDSYRGVTLKAWGGSDGNYEFANDYAHQGIVSGNHIYNTVEGVRIGSNDVIVETNIITDSAIGIIIQGSNFKSLEKISISNNILKNLRDFAITTETSEQPVGSLFLSNNITENVGGYGYYLRALNVNINGDTIIDSQVRGLFVNPILNTTSNVFISGVQIKQKNKVNLENGIRLGAGVNLEGLVANCLVTNSDVVFLHDRQDGKITQKGNIWADVVSE